MRKLLFILIILPAGSLFAQNSMSNLFSKKTKLVFLGVDFTQAKYIGSTGFPDPELIRNQYLPEINQLIELETKKFSLQNAFKLDENMYMSNVKDMISLNKEIDVTSNITDKPYTITETEVVQAVSRYSLSQNEGIGIVYVAESLFKGIKGQDEKPVFTAWITFIDLSTRRVLYTEKIKVPAGGFGFRNFWARGVFEINEIIKDKLYKKWKVGVVELDHSLVVVSAPQKTALPYGTTTLNAIATSAKPVPEMAAPLEKAPEPIGSGASVSALLLKKQILTELFEELPKKGFPSDGSQVKKGAVYVFFVGKRNVTTYISQLLPVTMYSDNTWPSGKDTRKRFAGQLGLPIEKVAMVGFFEDSLLARQTLNDYKGKIFAYDINSLPVQFDINPSVAQTEIAATKLSTGSVTPKMAIRATQVINLPDVDVTGKYRPTIGLMPIIDTETNLNQQFLVYQYLKDNPVILKGSDTLVASLTDYRAYTQFALGGTMDQNVYKLKLWQKAKLLAEIVLPLPADVSLDERMTLIARQLGKILSGNTEQFKIQQKIVAKNLVDELPVIKDEVRKTTWITALFPDVTTHYLPSGFRLPATLSHLSSRVITTPYVGSITPNILAQKVRAIYQQSDEKQFFFTNSNIPIEMKEAVRKITQPTSRRIGSTLSYLVVGDSFHKNKDYDGAACSYYSALLLSQNLVASALEKSAVKKMVYERMKVVAELRNQPYLADLFKLVADLNTSFIESPFAKGSDQQYYDGIKKIAEVCFNAESQARDIRAQQRLSGIQSLLAVGGAIAQVSAGGTFSEQDKQALESKVQGYEASVQQSKAIFAETFQDLKYENFNVEDENGNLIELNRLYLNLEVLWHLALRKDQDVVGKRLLIYAADKPSLKIALEEYLAETDESQLSNAVAEFQNLFQGIEAQVNSYESWGKKLPKKVLGRF